MWRQMISAGWLLALFAGRADVVDRIAVTVGKAVITESDIVRQIRITAFLNGESADLSPPAKRKAAERLVEQALIRREMEISRYPAPAQADAEAMLEKLRKERFDEEAVYRQELAKHKIAEADLKQNLLLQLTTLRFIEFRFRPGIAVSDSEVEEYYRKKFLPQWAKRSAEPAPELEDAREEIETILTGQKVDQALDQWMRQSRAQTRVQFREEVFR